MTEPTDFSRSNSESDDEDATTPNAEGVSFGCDRPWSPSGLSTLTFLSPTAGGALFIINFDRLGEPSRRLSAGVVVLLTTVLMYAGMMYYAAESLPRHANGHLIPPKQRTQQQEDDYRAVKFNAKVARQVVCVLLAMYLSRQQRPRFLLFEMTGQKKRRLLLPALGAFLVGTIVEGALVISLLTFFLMP